MAAWSAGLSHVVYAKPVLFLITHLRPDRVTPLIPSPGRPATSRPTVAVDYNLNKGHVDQVDQVRSYHAVQRRGRRSWPALAWWLLDTASSTPTSCGTSSTALRRRYWTIARRSCSK